MYWYIMAGHKKKSGRHKHKGSHAVAEQTEKDRGTKRQPSQSPEGSSSTKKHQKTAGADKMIQKKPTFVLTDSSESDDESSESETETESDLEGSIAAAVHEQLAALRGQFKGTRPKTKTKSPSQQRAAAKTERHEEASTSSGNAVKDILAELRPLIVRTIQDTIKNEIKKVVKSAVEEELSKMREEVETTKKRLAQYAQQQALRARYECDNLEQHGRKGSVRISGIKEEQDEDVVELVQKTAETAGVTVNRSDVSACHRLGPKRDGTRAIICKFVSRQTKSELMKNRRNLKDKPGYDRVYVNEDLTQLRKRLLDTVKRCPRVSRANTKDGKIFCNLRDAPDGRPVIIQSPDDLFKLGFEDIPYEELGLLSFVYSEG